MTCKTRKKKPKEQIKQRHAGRCRDRWWGGGGGGGGGSTRKEGDEELE